jgi:hypothetical protein
MSEEVLSAIKFQHQNLLRRVDYLRERVGTLTSVVTKAQAELEARKRDDRYPPPTNPNRSLHPNSRSSNIEDGIDGRQLEVIGNELRNWRDCWM